MGMGITPVTDVDEELVKEKLLQAAALRKAGMSGDTGAGMVGDVYVRGNPWGGIVQSLTGALLGNQARNEQRALADRQQQEQDAFIGRMPSATMQAEVQQATPEQQFGPTQAPVVTETINKPLTQYADETRRWAMTAPRGMEAVRGAALQQAMLAPEKMAEIQQRALDRKATLEATLADRAASREQREEAAKELLRMRLEAQRDMKYLGAALAASNRQPQRDRFSLITNADGSVTKVNLDTDEVKVLDGVNKGAKPLSKADQAKADAASAASNIDSLISTAKNNPDAFGSTPAMASMLPNALGSRITSNVLTKEQQKARNDIMRQGAIEIHKIYGAALARGEASRADSWAINPNDNYDTIMSKLESARDYARSISGKSAAPVERTIVREVQLKDGRTGVEYSDGTRGYK